MGFIYFLVPYSPSTLVPLKKTFGNDRHRFLFCILYEILLLHFMRLSQRFIKRFIILTGKRLS